MRIIMQGDREERPVAYSVLKQEEMLCHRDALCGLHSVFLCVTGACTLILRRGYVEAIAQGEDDTAGVVIIYLADHELVAVECEPTNATIEEVVA